MKKPIESIIISLSILTLFACSASIPENWDLPQSESESVSAYSVPEYYGSESVSTTAAAFVPNLPDCVSVNLTKLLDCKIQKVTPIDGRYLAVSALSNAEFLVDTERLYFTVDTATDPWNAVPAEPPEPYTEPEYYTYEMGSHTIRQIGGDIYEDKGGELTALLLHEGDDELDDFKGVSYHYRGQIDDNRFVYAIFGHEWVFGFGIYDVSTHEDAYVPDTNGLEPIATRNGVIFSVNSPYTVEMYSLCATDADTLETRRFPYDNNETFPIMYGSYYPVLEMFKLSEDGKILTFTKEGYLEEAVYTVYVINADDGGSVIWSRDFRRTDIGLDVEYVYFFGEDKLLMLSATYYDKYAHIIPIQ